MLKQELTQRDYKLNYWAFVWHASLLALSKSFFDTDTILPALILKAGGDEFLIGLMSAIMIGSAKFMQLFFAPYIASRRRKKVHLLIAINVRIFSALMLGLVILHMFEMSKYLFFSLLFVLMVVFSFFGAYGGVAYTDILGKSISNSLRLSLFSFKQMMQAIGFIISAFLVKQILQYFEFPKNYAYSFIIAAGILALGSIGFWILIEKDVVPKPKKKLLQFLKLIPKELKINPNLRYFLAIENLLGVFLALTPFIIAYVKSKIGLTGKIVGNLLILKMVGMVVGSFLVYKLKNFIRYKDMLYITAMITISVPVIAVFKVNLWIFYVIFFLIGIGLATFRIALEGVVIEISNDQNRAEYAGIAGAGNVSGIVFPFVLSFLSTELGFEWMFGFAIILTILTIPLIKKLNCRSEN